MGKVKGMTKLINPLNDEEVDLLELDYIDSHELWVRCMYVVLELTEQDRRFRERIEEVQSFANRLKEHGKISEKESKNVD